MIKKIAILIAISLMAFTPTQTPTEIVEQAYYNVRSNAYSLNMTMRLVRPKWSRGLSFKSWSLGADYGMMVIQLPAKDRGISNLRIRSEGWTWIPAIERITKISPSQMSQSWMGSDFTNEDLLKEASIVNDYTHTLLGEEEYQGATCYKIQATPKQDAIVVWGKVLLWIGKEDVLQRKAEYYDEDGTLINTLVNSNFKTIGGKKIATILEMKPSNKKGQKTVVSITTANFNEDLDESFFSKNIMKTLR